MRNNRIVHKILHIIESFDRGAVEAWLLEMAKENNKSSALFEWHFFTILPTKGTKDELAKGEGCLIHRSTVGLDQPFLMLRELRSLIRQEGFDIIHAHHDILSGLYALAAMGCNPKFVVHSHNNDFHLPVKKWKRHILIPIFRTLIKWRACSVLSISQYTLTNFIEQLNWKSNNAHVIYYGIELPPRMGKNAEITSFRGLKLLFVGRLIEEKGPLFALNVALELCKLRSSVAIYFVGEGDELASLESVAKASPKELHVSFMGWRNDVDEIMRSCDVFLFPRDVNRIEGFGFVMLEAQANGLLCAISRGISEDTIVCNELCRYMEEMDERKWAETIHEWESNTTITNEMKLSRGRERVASEKSISRSFNDLLQFYENIMAS